MNPMIDYSSLYAVPSLKDIFDLQEIFILFFKANNLKTLRLKSKQIVLVHLFCKHWQILFRRIRTLDPVLADKNPTITNIT